MENKKKNYKHATQEDYLLKMKSRLFFICATTMEKQETYEYLLERIRKEIYECHIWEKLTGYRRYYLRGFFDAFLSQINYMIEWKVYHPELGLIKSDSVPEGDWKKIISDKSKFVWKDSGKPYSLSEGERKEKNANSKKE